MNLKKQNNIRIFTTGGTIDGVDYVDPKYDNQRTTSIPDLLSRVTALTEVEVTELFFKNSLNFVDADYDLILKSCILAEEEKILITHGTLTMCETAKFLGEHWEKQFRYKTIVLTGAMKSPLKKDSDSLFNLGFALASVQYLSPGVYIAMNGLVFNWDNVKKDEETNQFVKIQ